MAIRHDHLACCEPTAKGGSCDDPLFVTVCTPVEDAEQVEISDLVLGCAVDGAGVAIGVVVLSKVVDEVTGIETQVRSMYPYGGGAAVTPYVGPFQMCGKPEITTVVGCYQGATPVSIHYIHVTGGSAPSVIVTDTFGVIIAAATAANTTVGLCAIVPVETKHLIYLEKNGGVITMADIMGATGANRVLSVTVKQMSGQGQITADAGGGVPFDAGETWSWSVVSDQNIDTLSASILTLDAGSGEQRITAIYVP